MALIGPQDLPFLLAESRATPMHVGGLQVFELPEGAPPTWVGDQFQRMLEFTEPSALFRKRPYRSARTGFQLAWRDDDQFDLEYHFRHSALPDPGRVRELLALGSRLHGSLLDRQRPLWEMNLIEGLEGNRFATYTKVHHSVVDGVSALRLLERSLSHDPTTATEPFWVYQRPSQGRPEAPDPSGPLEPLLSLLRGGVELAGVPSVLLASARKALEQDLAAFPFKAPVTMLNGHITGARRLAADSWDLPRVRGVAKAYGATLNDIILAMCSGALRAYLLENNALTDESLTSMVPVSMRRDDSAGGNSIGAVITSLATNQPDAALRVEDIRASMRIAKATLADRPPLQILALSAMNMFPGPLMTFLGGPDGMRPAFNTTISNVPGPRTPLYLNGARLQGVYPASIPFHSQGLNFTVTTYVDNLEFGLTGCRRSVPHLQRFLIHLEDSLVALEEGAGLVSNPKGSSLANGTRPAKAAATRAKATATSAGTKKAAGDTKSAATKSAATKSSARKSSAKKSAVKTSAAKTSRPTAKQPAR